MTHPWTESSSHALINGLSSSHLVGRMAKNTTPHPAGSRKRALYRAVLHPKPKIQIANSPKAL